jgi:hypothetical protein
VERAAKQGRNKVGKLSAPMSEMSGTEDSTQSEQSPGMEQGWPAWSQSAETSSQAQASEANAAGHAQRSKAMQTNKM